MVVRDFAGAPVTGARVFVRKPLPDQRYGWPGEDDSSALSEWRTLPPAWDLAPKAEARTGDDGKCEIGGVLPGEWSVVAEAPGRVSRAAACKVPAGGAVTEVQLLTETGHALEGTVTTESGAPVADALVLAKYPGVAPGGRCDDVPEDIAVTRADRAGRWRFDALPATVVDVSCGPPGAWSSHVWPVAVPSVSKLDLLMLARGPVTGVVRGEPDGKPVAGVEVVFGVQTWHTARTSARATTDAEGRYRIPLYPGEGVMDISIAADGWWRRPTVVGARQPPFRLYEDRATVLDLSLRPDTPEFAAVRGVVTGPDGPVAGAKVFLAMHGSGSLVSLIVATDSRGRFHFLDVPKGRLAVVVECDGGLYQPGTSGLFDDDGDVPDPAAPWWIAEDAPRPTDVVVALERGGRVSGRVVDAEGVPVAGAGVWTRSGTRSTSRDDGTFVIAGLDEPSEMTVFARTPDDSLAGESEKITAGAGKDAEGIEIRLAPTERENRYRHVVVNGRARPADESASRTAARAECDDAWTPIDATGAFRVECRVLATTRVIPVTIAFPAWGAKRVEVQVPAEGADADAGEVVVPRAATIRGVVDTAAGPLPGVPVRLGVSRRGRGIACGMGEDAQAPIVAVTGADGSYTARGLRPGKYELSAWAPGFVEEELEISIGDDSEVQWSLRLVREAFVRGRVVRKDGRPVARANVRADRVKESKQFSVGDWEYDTTDADGSFELRVREGSSWKLEITPETYREALDRSDSSAPAKRDPSMLFREFESEPIAAGAEPVTLVVDDGGAISGRVLTADGEPVAGAKLDCLLVSDERRRRTAETETDDEGRFEFSGLDIGTYGLSVEVGFASPVIVHDVTTGRTDVEIRVPAQTTIEGTLVDEDGDPAPWRRLVAVRESRRSDGRVSGMTDGEGKFRLEGVGDEPCRIELVNAGAVDGMSDYWPLLGGTDVSPGAKDVSLRIPARTATRIAGRVVDDAGKPFADCKVVYRVRPNVTIHHSCDVAGSSFESTGLTPGETCTLEIRCRERTWFVDLPVGTTDLVLTVGPDGLRRVTFGGDEQPFFPPK